MSRTGHAGEKSMAGKLSSFRSAEKQRHLTAEELNLSTFQGEDEPGLLPKEELAEVAEVAPYWIKDSDPILLRVQALIEDGYAGIILIGPPGTGKSMYAEQISLFLAKGDISRFRRVQFHPSYQYEDFIEGIVPVLGGGFEHADKHFLQMCKLAREYTNGEQCVLLIDELSRTDAVRVFGEALTYLEMDKRGRTFHLASGRSALVPKNLIIIATMNLFDRGVDDLDLALERRFGKIFLEPNLEALDSILIRNEIEESLRNRIGKFFRFLQQSPNRYCRIGHGYFKPVVDEPSLRRLWDHQLRFHFERVLELEDESLKELKREWGKIFQTEDSSTE